VWRQKRKPRADGQAEGIELEEVDVKSDDGSG
jgi:hypothetical protein